LRKFISLKLKLSQGIQAQAVAITDHCFSLQAR